MSNHDKALATYKAIQDSKKKADKEALDCMFTSINKTYVKRGYSKRRYI